MTRSISILMTLLVGAALLVSLLIWWLGPNLAHLALLHPQRTAPFTVLSLGRGAAPEVYRARYDQPLSELFISEGGVRIDGYRLQHQLSGSSAQTWTYLTRLQLPQAGDIAQVITASPYRAMANNLAELEHRLLGSFEPVEQAWPDTIVVWWLRPDPLAPRRGKDPIQPLVAALGDSPGALVWDAVLTPVEDAPVWQRVVAVGFSSESQALDWLRSPDVATARALTNARVHDLAVAIYARLPDGG